MLPLKEQVLGGVGEDRGGRTGADRLDWEERQLVAAGRAGWPVRRPGESYF